MAITNTRTVQRIEVYPSHGDSTPSVMVVYQHLFDDSEDDQLPVTTNNVVHLQKQTTVLDDEGNETTQVTDVTGHDTLVQSVCNAVWAE